ncbi:MAG: RluA family pseudouridine synthase [Nitrospira sp.]|nr:RluA family pseudouridine synthase [Nitrospira sp.]MEB2338283.1 RluA family pseudouridine synthase [Nitrospirales bacterium]
MSPFTTTPVEFVITPGESSKRIDRFLANRDPTFSRSALQRLIEEGRILVNGRTVRASQKIKPGDVIRLEVPRPVLLDIQPEAIPFEILHEDPELLVLNKPAGLVVHPAPGNWSGTLVNALLHHFATSGGAPSQIGGTERPGLVHRLDKETSGVMVVAKTDHAHRALAAQFKLHTITRVYEALIWGVPKKGHGVIELAIGRDTKERKKFSARSSKPKPSATEYEVDRRFGKIASHVRLFPRTGRTHQLRVHLASIDHPILGDQTYGGAKVMAVAGMEVPRVMLHARTLGFQHPVGGTYHQFDVPCPPDMEQVRNCLAASTTEEVGHDAGVRKR